MNERARPLAQAISEAINAAAAMSEGLDESTTEAEALAWGRALQGLGQALDAAPFGLGCVVPETRANVARAAQALEAWTLTRNAEAARLARLAAARLGAAFFPK